MKKQWLVSVCAFLIVSFAHAQTTQNYRESFIYSFGSGGSEFTEHVYQLPENIEISDTVNIRVGIKGDFNSSTEYADVYVNGYYVGRHDGGLQCSTYHDQKDFQLTATEFSSLLSGSEVVIRVENSSAVNACSSRTHYTELSFDYVEGSVPGTSPVYSETHSDTFPAGPGMQTNHNFYGPFPAGPAKISIGVVGDFNSSSELAYVYLDNQFIGAHSGGNNCGQNLLFQEFELTAYEMENFTADGHLWVSVRNSNRVDACPGEHEVRLEIEPSSFPFVDACRDCVDSCGECTYRWHYPSTHLGLDIGATVGDETLVIADGRVHFIGLSLSKLGGTDANGTELPGPAIIVEHKKENGDSFFAYYEHVYPNEGIEVGDFLRAGEVLGTIEEHYSLGDPSPHLHLGIWDSPSNPTTSLIGYGPDRYFVDPVPFLQNNRYIPWTE